MQMWKQAYEHSHHGHAGIARHSPRNGFNGFLRALPGVRILGCHRHRRIKACQSPVGMTNLRRFSTSNGCQDHTTSPSAKASFVCVPFVSSRALDPPRHPLTSPDAIASTASRPAFVTIASRPSVGRDGGAYIADLGQLASKISEIQKLSGRCWCGTAATALSPMSQPVARCADPGKGRLGASG